MVVEGVDDLHPSPPLFSFFFGTWLLLSCCYLLPLCFCVAGERPNLSLTIQDSGIVSFPFPRFSLLFPISLFIARLLCSPSQSVIVSICSWFRCGFSFFAIFFDFFHSLGLCLPSILSAPSEQKLFNIAGASSEYSFIFSFFLGR